jgi:hypothetical protein
MKTYWTINNKGRYRSLPVAQMRAERKYPGVVWGKPHQGPQGRICVNGKLPSECEDVIVLEEKSGYR